MRQDLDRERAAHEAAERLLHETRMTLVTTQTRLAHVEMDLQAAKEAAQEATLEAADHHAVAQAALAQAASAEAALAEASAAASPRTALPVRRRPRIDKAEKPEREPQPVRWWVKTEKA